MNLKMSQVNNYGNYAQNLIKYYGKYCGIFDKITLWNGHEIRKNDFSMVCPNIPEYAAELYGEEYKINFHLGGFSVFSTNAFLRGVGEAVERYSHLMAETKLKNKIIFASANELQRTGDRVCPLEYVNVYTKEQLKNIKVEQFTRRNIHEHDQIGWICCKSIYDDKPVYIPAQMFFLMSSNRKEKRYYMSVSTGTASHKTKEKALLNALIEYLQVDSWMLHWYVFGEIKRVHEISNIVKRLIGKVEYAEEYEIIFLDMSHEKPIYVVGCIMKHKKKSYPYCAFGMQADASMDKAMYRSFMEAYANIGTRFIGKEDSKADFDEIENSIQKNVIYDLENNTKFYLSSYGVDKVDEWLQKIIVSGESRIREVCHRNIYQEIMNYLSQESEYACYLEITSDEFKEDGWHVIRTVIPELLPLCMPSVPYEAHPRVKKYGGIRNRCIHPSP